LNNGLLEKQIKPKNLIQKNRVTDTCRTALPYLIPAIRIYMGGGIRREGLGEGMRREGFLPYFYFSQNFLFSE
jgi:hypothetical protein